MQDKHEASVETSEQQSDRMAFAMVANNILMGSRSAFASQLGKTYGDNRDLYASLGYKTNLTFTDYWNKYRRGDIASRLIDAPVDATWRGIPEIQVDGEPWEDFNKLAESLKLWSYFERIDKLSSIGQFAVLFLGYKDKITTDIAQIRQGDDGAPTQNLDKPVENATEIAFVRPYSQTNATILKFDNGVTSERFGKPIEYNLKTQNIEQSDTNDAASTSQLSLAVNYTRVIHVAQGLLESEVYGTPVLQAIFNRLDDLEKVVGGSSEMYWRGAFPGMAFETDPEAEIAPAEIKRMNKEIEAYVHSLKRYLRLSGTKAKPLSPNITSPKDNIDSLIMLISATSGIPQRILTGSERGELASTQDESNWFARVDERRLDFAEPQIVRQFIDEMIEQKILKAPKEGYEVVWPDLAKLSEESASKINERRMKIIASYIQTGAGELIPPEAFLVDFVGYTEEKAKELVGAAERMIDDESAAIDALDDDDDEGLDI